MSIGAWRLLWTLADKSLTSGFILVLSIHSSWQACLLPVGARLNTARSDGQQSVCGRSQRSDRTVHHRRSACTNQDMPPRTASAAF